MAGDFGDGDPAEIAGAAVFSIAIAIDGAEAWVVVGAKDLTHQTGDSDICGVAMNFHAHHQRTRMVLAWLADEIAGAETPEAADLVTR